MAYSKYFIVDIKTDDSARPVLSISAIAYDAHWQIISEYSCSVKNPVIRDKKAKEEILPYLNNTERKVPSEQELVEDFADFWCKYRNHKPCIYTEGRANEILRLLCRCDQVKEKEPPEKPYKVKSISSPLMKQKLDHANAQRQKSITGLTYESHHGIQKIYKIAQDLQTLPGLEPEPYSYHTFIFPFLFDKDDVVDTYLSQLNKDYWKEDLGIGLYKSRSSGLEREAFILNYNRAKYFNSAAQNCIYTLKNRDNIVHNLHYELPKDAQFIIKTIKENESGKKVEDEFRLDINALRLKVFNTGIGMLIYELENRESRDPDRICRINEFGRRVYPQFIELNDDTDELFCHLNALDLRVQGKNEKAAIFSSCPQKLPEEQDDQQKKKNKEKYGTVLADIIRIPLSMGRKRIEVKAPGEKRKRTEKVFYIEPIVDDRMFTACFYNSKGLVAKMKQWQADGTDPLKGDYRFMNDALRFCPDHEANLAGLLYKLIFVDVGDPTCQSRIMLHSLLKEHIYTRWIEWGTISGISEYSMISIGDEAPEHLVNAFLTEYVEMLIIVLAQRASLLAFERRLSDASLGVDDIQDIQKDYTKFQSQLLLQEVTPQQQGIELYDMLRKHMFILKEQRDIEIQIRNLFDQSENDTANRQNSILFALSLIAIFEGVDVVTGWCSSRVDLTTKIFIVIVILSVMFIFIGSKHLKKIITHIQKFCKRLYKAVAKFFTNIYQKVKKHH